MKFYDTNALLELMDDVLVEPFVISSVTLEELENIKTSKTKTEEIRYKARKVVHLLDENRDKYEVVIYTDSNVEILNRYSIEVTNDSKICACAKEWTNNRDDELLFVTNDICCRIIAEDVFRLKVERAINTDNSIYKGYKSLIGDTEYINTKLTDESYVNSFVVNEYVLIHSIASTEFVLPQILYCRDNP